MAQNARRGVQFDPSLVFGLLQVLCLLDPLVYKLNPFFARITVLCHESVQSCTADELKLHAVGAGISGSAPFNIIQGDGALRFKSIQHLGLGFGLEVRDSPALQMQLHISVLPRLTVYGWGVVGARAWSQIINSFEVKKLWTNERKRQRP